MPRKVAYFPKPLSATCLRTSLNPELSQDLRFCGGHSDHRSDWEMAVIFRTREGTSQSFQICSETDSAWFKTTFEPFSTILDPTRPLSRSGQKSHYGDPLGSSDVCIMGLDDPIESEKKYSRGFVYRGALYFLAGRFRRFSDYISTSGSFNFGQMGGSGDFARGTMSRHDFAIRDSRSHRETVQKDPTEILVKKLRDFRNF